MEKAYKIARINGEFVRIGAGTFQELKAVVLKIPEFYLHGKSESDLTFRAQLLEKKVSNL